MRRMALAGDATSAAGAKGQSPEADIVLPGARSSLVLLLLINLFNYIDRYVLAAVEPAIRDEFFRADDPKALAKMGSLATAFMVSYMVAAPLFGWLADRMSRWLLVGVGVILWSLASGGSGLAPAFGILLITRLFVGIGEAGYGPAAPTIISDLYPVRRRGAVLSWFYMAIPVGSALGYVLGGVVAQYWGWRWAFYVVVPPGILLGVLCLLKRDPRVGTDAHKSAKKATLRDYLALLRIRSYVLDCAGMTAMTFAIGGISFWMPHYVAEYRQAGSLAHVNTVFGGLTVVGGLTATLLGGITGDKLRDRFPGSYFLVSGAGILIACPFVILMLYTPFPAAWAFVFLAVFFLFFNTGPSNTILANVTRPGVRATAFALNIFVIHALGDAVSPPLLGAIVGAEHRWNAAFFVVAGVMALAGVLWLVGAKYLEADTRAASEPSGAGAQPDNRSDVVSPV
jgi:MFS family permease